MSNVVVEGNERAIKNNPGGKPKMEAVRESIYEKERC